MNNNYVKFRRGGSDLPDSLSDGYVSIDVENRKLYMDTNEARLLVDGSVFCVPVSFQEGKTIVTVAGVPEYSDGLTIKILFTDKGDDETDNNVTLSIVDDTLGVSLPFVPVVKSFNDGSAQNLMVSDIDINRPYELVYFDGRFLTLAGTGGGGGSQSITWNRI